MYRIDAAIQGVAPFLFNRMVDPDALDRPSGGSGRRTADDKETEATGKVYRDEKGLYWPSWNLKKCLLVGVKMAGLKEGRGSLVPYVEGTVFIEREPRFENADGTPKLEADFMHKVVGKIPPKTGAAAIIRRPALETGWVLRFALNVVDDRRDERALRRALDEAGLLAGMGSWRPEHGRFIVTDWQVTK
jgi:hypothetical protein